MSGRFLVYRLRDPRDKAVRYIGITSWGLEARLGNHIRHARHGDARPCAEWVRLLLHSSLKPTIELVEETDDAERENYWIARYREDGHKLTNMTLGGESVNRIFTAQHRAHLSAAIRGRRYSPEACAAMGAARRGKSPSTEVRQRLSEALKGKPWSDARRKKGMPGRCLLTFHGETRTLTEWSALTGIKAHTIRQRISAYGWDVERALTTQSDARYTRQEDGRADGWTPESGERLAQSESGVWQ